MCCHAWLEADKVTLEASRRATHASAWRKCEKWVPKLLQMIGFCRNFEFFPKGPESLKIMFHDVFWCSGALGTFLEWFWVIFRSLIFSWYFCHFLDFRADFKWSCARARCIILQIWSYRSIQHVLKYFWLEYKPKRTVRSEDILKTPLKSHEKRVFPNKMSQFFKNLTSPTLIPYYSLRAQEYALRVMIMTPFALNSKYHTI